ncbi:MAG TPA: TCR/Tet family MFS transporter [Caulobacteraceae bacterium]|nr:TCR/Tet family MFS transporter [Caulobacteraceae bacterium]
MNAAAQDTLEAAGPAPTRGRQAAFGFIYISSVLNALSFGLMIPVLPGLIRSFFGATANVASTAAAADWQFVFTLVWGAMQFFSGPILGMMSDRFGRRPVLLISIFGLATDFLVMTFAPTLAWLLIGRVINGATAASFSTANAYVADIATPQTRARYFGWMSSAFSVGFLFGPAAGGFLSTLPVHIGSLHLEGLRTPFLVAALLCAINWVYGLLVLPESLPVERRIPSFQWRRANPIGALSLLRSHQDLLPLATINFLNQVAQQVLPGIFVLYTQLRYGWSLGFLGVTLLFTGILGILVQAFVVGPVVRRIGERGAVLVGASAGMIAFVIYAFASNQWLYFLGMPIFALMGLMMPGLQGLMTQHVAPTEQGRLQGAGQSTSGIASVIGPIFPLTFALALRHTPGLPGLPILIAAALLAVAMALALRFARRETNVVKDTTI